MTKKTKLKAQANSDQGQPHGTCLVVNNPVSGTRTEEEAEQEIDLICQLLGERFATVDIFTTTPDSDAAGWVTEKMASRPEVQVVVACGGDGTVSEIASAVQTKADSGRDAPSLGLIPRGTGNAIALTLGVPTQLPDACRIITHGKPRRLDLARVTDLSAPEQEPRSFPLMLLAGIGLEAQTVKNADRQLKNKLGPFAYLLSGIRSFAEQEEPFNAEISLEGVSVPMGRKATLKADGAQLLSVEATAITVANAAPPTSVLAQGLGEVIPDDGMVELIVFNPPTMKTGLSAMWAMEIAGLFRKRLARLEVWGVRAKSISLKCNPPQAFVVDGEMMEVGDKGVTVTLGHPINVLAPSKKEARKRFFHIARSVRRTVRNIRGLAVFALVVWYTKQKTLKRA